MPILNNPRGIFGRPRTVKPEDVGLANQGIFNPGAGITPSWQEALSINLEQNGPLDVPPARALPKLMEKPPNLGMSSYPDVENYRSALRTQPRREEHKLGKWGKLAAFGSGLAEGYNRGVQPGIEVGLGLMDRPYNQALEDWKTKTAGAGELANLEIKTDEINRKRREDEYKVMFDYNKQLTDWEEMKSRLNLNEAQIRNYDSQIRDRNAEVKIEDGRGWIIHKNPDGKPVLEDLGPLGESKAQGRGADWVIRQQELDQQLKNNLKLEKERHTGDEALVRQRAGAEESLLRLRYDLEAAMTGVGIGGVSVDNFKKAWDLAVQQMWDVQPELTRQLFDDEGNVRPENRDNTALWENYRQRVRERVSDLVGWTVPPGGQNPSRGPGSSRGTTVGPGSSGPGTTGPTNTGPTGTSGWPAQNTPITPRNRTPGQDPPDIGVQINEALRLLAPNSPELQTDSVSRNRVREAIRKDPQYLEKLRRETEQAGQGIEPAVPPVQLPPGATLNPRIQLPATPQPQLTFQGRPLNVAPARPGIFGPIDVPVGMGNMGAPIIPFPLTNSERRLGTR